MRFQARTAAILCAVFCLAGQVKAQPRSHTGLNPLLPIVPGTQPRPLDGEGQTLADEPRRPIAGFLEAVTTADAILEIIVGQARILTTKAPIAQEGGIAL